MRIPTLAVTLAAAAAVVAVPTTAHAVTPDAVDDSVYAAFEGVRAFNVLTNDTNPDTGETLTVTTPAPEAANGTVACQADGDCTYAPDDDWTGVDTFTYSVSDGGATPETDTATVTVETVNVGTVGITMSKTTLKYPGTVDFTGFVRNPSGAGVAGVTVTLMGRPSTEGGVYTPVTTATTTSTGAIPTKTITPQTSATYRWEVVGVRNSVSRFLPLTPQLDVVYEAKKLAVGDINTITATTAPVAEGAVVNLERRLNDGTWSVVDTHTAVVSSTGSQDFAFNVEALPGSRIYRVAVPESGGRAATTSSSTTIRGYQAQILSFEPADDSEWVKIENTGKVSFNLEDWVLSDSDSTVRLPNRSVAAGDILRIHSGNGTNGLRNLYLKRSARFWTNASTITLSDNREATLDVIPDPVVVP